MEIVLLLMFIGFVFAVARRILEKAGIDPIWAFALAIPVVGVIMVWVFALTEWPNLKKNPSQWKL